MREAIELIVIWLLGVALGFLLCIVVIINNPQKTFKSKKKLILDYELTVTNGKIVDTVWVYQICF